jgi:hypothetical protein
LWRGLNQPLTGYEYFPFLPFAAGLSLPAPEGKSIKAKFDFPYAGILRFLF